MMRRGSSDRGYDEMQNNVMLYGISSGLIIRKARSVVVRGVKRSSEALNGKQER